MEPALPTFKDFVDTILSVCPSAIPADREELTGPCAPGWSSPFIYNIAPDLSRFGIFKVHLWGKYGDGQLYSSLFEWGQPGKRLPWDTVNAADFRQKVSSALAELKDRRTTWDF